MTGSVWASGQAMPHRSIRSTTMAFIIPPGQMQGTSGIAFPPSTPRSLSFSFTPFPPCPSAQ